MSLLLKQKSEFIKRVENHFDPEFNYIVLESSNYFISNKQLNPYANENKYNPYELINYLVPIITDLIVDRENADNKINPINQNAKALITRQTKDFYTQNKEQIANNKNDLSIQIASTIAYHCCKFIPNPDLKQIDKINKEKILISTDLSKSNPSTKKKSL